MKTVKTDEEMLTNNSNNNNNMSQGMAFILILHLLGMKRNNLRVLVTIIY